MATVRIANAAGFWGDWLEAPKRTVEAADVDYLTLEYLAELTLSVLAHQRSRNPDAGYVTDFPLVLESLTSSLASQQQLKIITNAGGMNPAACARETARILVGQGLPHESVGVVTGDDLLSRFEDLSQAGETFSHMETGEPLGD
ncbi:MAG: acyclic terpene utilization AtuA family protein, partial [Planctomycetaceae bacterium]|nr:acyclic terpene utilization AtuA family protein [Planctomycetaceae bacterium]